MVFPEQWISIDGRKQGRKSALRKTGTPTEKHRNTKIMSCVQRLRDKVIALFLCI